MKKRGRGARGGNGQEARPVGIRVHHPSKTPADSMHSAYSSSYSLHGLKVLKEEGKGGRGEGEGRGWPDHFPVHCRLCHGVSAT